MTKLPMIVTAVALLAFQQAPAAESLRLENGTLALHFDASSQNANTVVLAYRPNLEIRAGETLTCEPALFFNIRPNAQPTASGQTRLNSAANGVMANWWLQSEALIPENRPKYQRMQAGLQAFFGGLANCGALCDNANHHFGNQCDGFLYAGNMWMHAYSLLASVPAKATSPAPVSYPEAFRKYLVAILQSVDRRGEVKYGFRHPPKDFPESGAIGLLAVEADLLYTGYVSLARAHRETMQRMLDYCFSSTGATTVTSAMSSPGSGM